MKIVNYRYIKALSLPIGWVENNVPQNFGPQITRSFSPANNSAVNITLFYRGFPLSESAAASFKRALSNSPQVIFDAQNNPSPEELAIELVCNLEEVLGNVGNNQITNTGTGPLAPPFVLNRLEAMIWNNKPILAARGTFYDPEEGKPLNEFCGFFVYVPDAQGNSNVEEIYLEAQTKDLFFKYLPAFTDCLKSIEWLSK